METTDGETHAHAGEQTDGEWQQLLVAVRVLHQHVEAPVEQWRLAVVLLHFWFQMEILDSGAKIVMWDT